MMRQRRFNWRNIISAVPDFAFAAAFLITWLMPDYFGETMVRRFMFIMLIEFIVVHSTGFLGVVAIMDIDCIKKTLYFCGLFLFYCLFAGAFSATAGHPWPLYTFLGLTLAKFPAVVLERHDEKRQEALMGQWASMMAFYVVFVLLTAFIPVPRLGVTPDAVAAQGFKTQGIWVEQPYRVLAAGFLYFFSLGLVELFRKTGDHYDA